MPVLYLGLLKSPYHQSQVKPALACAPTRKLQGHLPETSTEPKKVKCIE